MLAARLRHEGFGAAAFAIGWHAEPKRHRREGWWAREGSNLQPDGYEPSALTIELQARREPHNRVLTAPRAR
jgi:hypothetical protein